jgi:regulator of protease activity HflC (stomatin/prohibitin superfamily)
MSQTNVTSDRRARHVAALGFLLQLVSFGAMLALGIWSKSDAIIALARWMFAALPIWGVLYLIFKQLGRVSAEELETAELRHAREAGASDSIFEVDDEALLLERNRLRWMVKWMLPGTTVFVALLLIVGQFLFWPWTLGQAWDSATGVRRTDNPTMLMWFVIVIGFCSFVGAHYSVALSRIPSFRLLHSGGSFMAGNAVFCLALAIALGAGSNIAWAEPLIAYVIRVALLLVGIELAVNFVLDFYRPRTAGVVPRPSFDSRILALIADPGGIARSIAETINYQFGFEVSSTWFYKLLQQWLLPIVVCTAMIVLALTSIVIVDAGEAVVVERFGRPTTDPPTVLGPGLHLKLPFPVDIVHRAPALHIRESVLGEVSGKIDEHPKDAIVWTEEHEYSPELMLLVGSGHTEGEAAASPTKVGERSSKEDTQSVAVSLLMVSVPISYRVSDPVKFLHNYSNPVGLMESIGYQMLSDFAAGTDIDTLMGPGRSEFNRKFKGQLQEKLDELKIGIEIVFAGIRDAHPPAKDDVAQTFLSVVNAQTQRAATIEVAEGEARKILISVAGTESRARALNDAIEKRDALRNQETQPPVALAEADQQVEDLLLGNSGKAIPPLSGKAAAQMARAKAEATQRVAQAAAKARAFGTDVAAYSVAPDLFRQRKFLEMYRDLSDVRKYLIVGDPSNVIVEYETSEQGGLDRVLDEGISKGK